MARSAKTRYSSGSKLEELIGIGKELLTSYVPTLRAALQLGLYLQKDFMLNQEGDKRNYPVNKIMGDVAEAVIHQ